MRSSFLAAALVALPVHADLYRWVDPASGSVKYSSVAPSWYGEPGRPPVEVLPAQPQAAAAKDKPVEAPAAALEARWRSYLQGFEAAAAGGDFERAARLIQGQMEAYQSVVAELDRADPGGKKRRLAEEQMVLEKLKR
jgi:hypothetical protein